MSSRAVSTMEVKELCRCSAVVAVPLKGQSEMVRRARAFYPARAALA